MVKDLAVLEVSVAKDLVDLMIYLEIYLEICLVEDLAEVLVKEEEVQNVVLT